MKNRSAYSVTISGLAPGMHTFAFAIGDSFFAEYEEGEVKHGQLTANVIIEKKGLLVQLDVAIAGEVTVECDRCLEDLSLPIVFRGMPVAKYIQSPDEELAETDEDILWIEPMEKDVDLTQYFYDSIILSLPLQRVHNEGECSKEMMLKLEQFKIK